MPLGVLVGMRIKEQGSGAGMGGVLTSSFSAPSRRLNVISPIPALRVELRKRKRVSRQARTRTKRRGMGKMKEIREMGANG